MNAIATCFILVPGQQTRCQGWTCWLVVSNMCSCRAHSPNSCPTVAQQFHFVHSLVCGFKRVFVCYRQRQKFKCSLCIAIISLVETTNRLGHPRSQGQSDSTAVCRQVAAGSCQDDMAKNGALCSACFCKRLKFFIWTYIGFMTLWSYTHAHTHTRTQFRQSKVIASIYLSFLSYLSYPVFPVYPIHPVYPVFPFYPIYPFYPI